MNDRRIDVLSKTKFQLRWIEWDAYDEIHIIIKYRTGWIERNVLNDVCTIKCDVSLNDMIRVICIGYNADKEMKTIRLIFAGLYAWKEMQKTRCRRQYA